MCSKLIFRINENFRYLSLPLLATRRLIFYCLFENDQRTRLVFQDHGTLNHELALSSTHLLQLFAGTDWVEIRGTLFDLLATPCLDLDALPSCSPSAPLRTNLPDLDLDPSLAVNLSQPANNHPACSSNKLPAISCICPTTVKQPGPPFSSRTRTRTTRTTIL